MTERERLVEDVVKAADAFCDWSTDGTDKRPQREVADPLHTAIDALRAHDAAPKPLKWGCVLYKAADGTCDVHSPSETHYLQCGAWHRYTLGRKDDGKVQVFHTESAALSALDACNEPPPGYVEPTDDPQATPAGETPSLASRVAELERRQRNHGEKAESIYEMVSNLRREVDAMRARQATQDTDINDLFDYANKNPTPSASPEPPPFGFVAHQYPSGGWSIRTANGKWWWGTDGWHKVTPSCAGWARTRDLALADFHSTNGGNVPPPDHKPASEGRYSVEPCPHSPNLHRITRDDGLYCLIELNHVRWVIDAWTPLPEFAALAVRDALEARNG